MRFGLCSSTMALTPSMPGSQLFSSQVDDALAIQEPVFCLLVVLAT